MNVRLLVLLLALTTLTARAQQLPAAQPSVPAPPSAAVLDAQSGFRAYRFGTPMSQLPQFKEHAQGVYSSSQEPMMLGSVRLTLLVFQAVDNRLAGVVYRTTGAGNGEKLLAALLAEYGPPERTATPTRMTWAGKNVSMSYEQGMRTWESNGRQKNENFAQVKITYTPLLAQDGAAGTGR